ncbi:beta-ketoacyl-[acyl-carrier-protein] synthase II [Pseudomonas sp. J237]|nr:MULTISPECIES: beta-ketoacyl-[acyl-carrier-protein] synthase family protein [Pseudomonas]OEO27414.1 beta-ketoacyl-[acyl-carrier-protein] synthase II [Pseudomonas sp. J237]
MPSYLNALGVICSLGTSCETVAAALFKGDTSGMRKHSGWVTDQALTIGAVDATLPPMPAGMQHCASRNNQLLLAAALQIEPQIRLAIERFGSHRVAVVIGTSTSGIDEASQGIAAFEAAGALPADYNYAQQEIAAPAAFLSEWLGLSGPVYSISTACTSSARALLSAHRLLSQGVCDVVLCGGADSLCGLTLNGFSALEAVTAERCNPFSNNRQGINIGEGAALFIMTRQANEPSSRSIALLGGGACSDAHHISAPEPNGLGAQQAMHKALQAAGLAASDIDYLNLHGTATQHNDAMESLAVQAVFPEGVCSSSTKPLSGHTLGAAGALEAAFCWLTLSEHNRQQLAPPHIWDGQFDPQLPRLQFASPSYAFTTPARVAMSNSFAFGGSNVSLILGVV